MFGWPRERKNAEILDALHVAHDIDDLIGFFLQNFQVIAVNFGGQFALHAADRLFHVVFNGLREIPTPLRGSCRVPRFMAAINSSLFS
jgi:hypothetical protein